MFGSFLEEKYTAAIYIRVSSAKQVAEGHGLDAQLTKCRDLIHYKRWAEYSEIYSDEGLSGTLNSDERPKLKKLLEDGEKRLFDCVVFYSLDRLGRSSEIILSVVNKMRNLKLKIVSCQEHIDSTTASGELMLTFFAGIAQYEKRNIIERMEIGKKELRKKNGEYGGSIPLGYRRGTGGDIEIVPEQASLVQTIFATRANGMSYQKIADCLNNLGIKTRKGKKWYGTTVKVIIDNQDKYEGCLRNDNLNGINWPKILTYN